MNGKTILVVEDNAQNRELVADLLALSGVRVLLAEDAEAGLEIAAQEVVDLILMDVSLPRMDGLEAARRLKSSPVTARLPVIALTAHAMKGDKERIMAAGCDGYLTKPIDTRTFTSSVAQFLTTSATTNAS
ncbi:MAG TPA: response regulator [Opitutales bacterium]|nr:response regulator [Opitutales bacterium]